LDLLESLLCSKSRARILGKLFLVGGVEYYLRELERSTGVGVRSLHSDLLKLKRLDLIGRRKDGNRYYYKANEHHPLYEDLKSIVNKIYGPLVTLKEILSEREDIEFAFIYGSFATGETHAESDIDLFVIGKIGSRNLSNVLYDVQSRMSWILNPHCHTFESFKKGVSEKRHFLMALKASNKIFIKGSEIEFKQLYQK